MDRFFSKLDLRDIKIDPFKTSFPPDAEDEPVAAEAAPAPVEPVTAAAEPAAAAPERRPHVPAWAAPAADQENGPAAPVDDFADAPAVPGNGANGHAAAFVGEAAATAVGGEVLKVSARSRPSAVAGAIAGVVREFGRAEVQAIGAGATNQAVKAVAIARDYLRETGIEAVCLPAFIDITIENEDRTAIRLVVEPR